MSRDSCVAAAAILPAVAYYFRRLLCWWIVWAAKHQNAAQEQDAKIKVERTILPRLYLLLPAVILVVMIIRGASLMRAGMMGIVSCLICDVVSYFINEKKDFVDLKGIWNCCLDGAKQAAEIAIPTAACGIIINVVTGQTSLATNLSALISSLGTTNLFAAMLIAMIGCMLLGMALPTVAAYLVGVILFVPCLRALGISALCANMFVFYYGIMAQITPPVCVASYTAAGIADANAMKTGIKGFTFAMVASLFPLSSFTIPLSCWKAMSLRSSSAQPRCCWAPSSLQSLSLATSSATSSPLSASPCLSRLCCSSLLRSFPPSSVWFWASAC